MALTLVALVAIRFANPAPSTQKNETQQSTQIQALAPAPTTPTAPYDPYVSVGTSGTDAHTNLFIQIHRMVKGWDVVNLRYAYEHQFAEAQRNGKDLIWYDMTISNIKLPGDLNVSPSHFHLIDSQRYSWPYESSHQQISSVVQVGMRTRGGILFEVPTDSVPLLLHYDPGIILRSPLLEEYGVAPEKVVAYVQLVPNAKK